MRDFSWNMFCATGDVDAYMLYKEMSNGVSDELVAEEVDDIMDSDAISEHLG